MAQVDEPCSGLWFVNDVTKGSNMVTYPHGQQTWKDEQRPQQLSPKP